MTKQSMRAVRCADLSRRRLRSWDKTEKKTSRRKRGDFVRKVKALPIIAVVVFSCIVMAVVDGVLASNYFVKSAIKLVLFLALPIAFSCIYRDVDLKSLFKTEKKYVFTALFLGVGVFAVIFLGYMLLSNVFDFSGITGALTGNIGVNRDNFVIVSIYISFVNSLLEEFFFRGFAFLTLSKASNARFAHIFSALLFALYHVAMMIGWFDIGVFAIVLVGLFAGGIIFNLLNSKSGSIYPSWLTHMFANFAINTIGFMLFGIL